ncbi:ABC transporter permease [Halorubellus sp. JP-L1]|uniref:ABC transporter permease subunit n=1 Tax=Halorubellus sp. JP-L1 TaxID=2715753 RepID=UPI0014080732|nr:ABC transporter permease subunit [Halorubellus sp. JP-L1]NHN42250.1 ABC transporter permease [Halorubellus sp. JP-L1]
MNVATVARKDFEDAARAKTLWALVVIFSLFLGAAAWFFGDIQAGSNAVAGDALLASLTTPTSIFLPIMGIMVGYKAIVGERTSGTIKLLLSLPNTRQDVLAGKFLGRSAVVGTAVVVGSLVGAIVFAIFASSFPAVEYLAFLLLTVVLGAVFVAIGIGFSASTKSDTIAIVGAIALVLLFTLLWNIFTFVLTLLLNEFTDLASETLTDVLGFTNAINPTGAYSVLIRDVLSDSAQQAAAGQAMGAPSGFYTETWFAAVVLLFWLAVPLAFGYWRFENAELG